MTTTKTDTMTIADELLAAAEKVRGCARQAPGQQWTWDGPIWGLDEDDDPTCTTLIVDEQRKAIAYFPFPHDPHAAAQAEHAGPWIMLMSPHVAQPLAAWLEETAQLARVLTDQAHACIAHALAVARALPKVATGLDGGAA